MKNKVRRPALITITCMILISVVFSGQAFASGIDLSSLFGDSGLGSLLSSLSSASSSSGSVSSETTDDMGMLLGLLGVTQRKISDCRISSISDRTYTGSEITPLPVITWNGTRLKKGTDYRVTWSDNIKVGTAKCRITGKGDYTGTKTISFKIVKKGSSSSGSSKKETESASSSKTKKFTVTLDRKSFIYNGKPRKPKVAVKAGGKSVPSSGYTVSYKNNKNVGKAEVTVKGKGDYKNYKGGTTFYIDLKKVSFKSVKAGDPQTIVCTWNTDAQCGGYQIEYCTNKAFKKSSKKITIRDSSANSLTVEKLVSGKKYYVRLRSFKKVGRSNRYSDWSSERQVSVK